MKVIWKFLQTLTLCYILILSSTTNSFAEGSWQIGLKEGLSHAQPLFQWNDTDVNVNTGIKALERPIYVDITDPDEIINIHVCGESNADTLSIEIYDENGTILLDAALLSAANVDCSHDFSTSLAGGYEFAPGVTGTYQIRLDNMKSSTAKLNRFDLFVKPDASAIVDPTVDQGRLWAYRWAFDAGTYDESASTSANLYAVADGGFNNTYYVWELNLDHFAGYVYELVANNTGLKSPNEDGTSVAGLSGCIESGSAAPCPVVSGNVNSIPDMYKLYFSDPAVSYPRPKTLPKISNFRFLDDEGVDDSISPSETITIQDTGDFFFTTNLATPGTYTIIIDINNDDVFGNGDVYLNGTALPGDQNVSWDGRDNTGVPISNGNYKANIILKTGEFHFVAADVETSGGDNGGLGLTINTVLNDGTVDTSNKVYWDDSTYMGLTNPQAFNADGRFRNHNWGMFSGTGDGNRAFLDTYTVGAASAPVFVRLAIEPSDEPDRTKIVGRVFDDANANGQYDIGENGFTNITVALTDSTGTFYVSTDSEGKYEAYVALFEQSVTVDVNESMLPEGYRQTAGEDSEVVDTSVGKTVDAGDDGYCQNRTTATNSISIKEPLFATDLPNATDNLNVPVTGYNPTVINVLANGDTFGGNGAGNTAILFTQPLHGFAALDDGGTSDDPTDDVLLYTPEADKNDISDNFTYTITDAQGNTSTARVTVNVHCASSQVSDSADALGRLSIIILMFFTMAFGLYFVRKEERGEG